MATVELARRQRLGLGLHGVESSDFIFSPVARDFLFPDVRDGDFSFLLPAFWRRRPAGFRPIARICRPLSPPVCTRRQSRQSFLGEDGGLCPFSDPAQAAAEPRQRSSAAVALLPSSRRDLVGVAHRRLCQRRAPTRRISWWERQLAEAGFVIFTSDSQFPHRSGVGQLCPTGLVAGMPFTLLGLGNGVFQLLRRPPFHPSPVKLHSKLLSTTPSSSSRPAGLAAIRGVGVSSSQPHLSVQLLQGGILRQEIRFLDRS